MGQRRKLSLLLFVMYSKRYACFTVQQGGDFTLKNFSECRFFRGFFGDISRQEMTRDVIFRVE